MSVDFWPEKTADGINYAPSLNVANGNADIPTRMMGASYEAYRIPAAQLDSALLRVKVAFVEEFKRQTVVTCDGRFTFCGCSIEQIERYRGTLIKIIEYCKSHNCDLVWG